MRYILHTENIKELLAGRAVRAGRREFRLSSDYPDRDILEIYVKNKPARDKFVIYFDTDKLEIMVMERSLAWPRKGAE